MDDLIDNGGNAQKKPSSTLPFSGAVLVLGIISIATFWLYGIPAIVCGIIAIVLHRRNQAVYLTDPVHYAESYKNSKAGNICAIIGLALGVLFLLGIVFVVLWFINNVPMH